MPRRSRGKHRRSRARTRSPFPLYWLVALAAIPVAIWAWPRAVETVGQARDSAREAADPLTEDDVRRVKQEIQIASKRFMDVRDRLDAASPTGNYWTDEHEKAYRALKDATASFDGFERAVIQGESRAARRRLERLEKYLREAEVWTGRIKSR